jgi:hypothetical protein
MFYRSRGVGRKCRYEDRVFGIRNAGMAVSTVDHPGYKSLILSALEDDRAGQTVAGLRSFRETP